MKALIGGLVAIGLRPAERPCPAETFHTVGGAADAAFGPEAQFPLARQFLQLLFKRERGASFPIFLREAVVDAEDLSEVLGPAEKRIPVLDFPVRLGKCGSRRRLCHRPLKTRQQNAEDQTQPARHDPPP